VEAPPGFPAALKVIHAEKTALEPRNGAYLLVDKPISR
jgi:hypothetical protein